MNHSAPQCNELVFQSTQTADKREAWITIAVFVLSSNRCSRRPLALGNLGKRSSPAVPEFGAAPMLNTHALTAVLICRARATDATPKDTLPVKSTTQYENTRWKEINSEAIDGVRQPSPSTCLSMHPSGQSENANRRSWRSCRRPHRSKDNSTKKAALCAVVTGMLMEKSVCSAKAASQI